MKSNATYFATLLPIAVLIYALWLDATKPTFYRIDSTVSSFLSNTYPNSQSETRTACLHNFLTTDSPIQIRDYYRALPDLSESDWYTKDEQLFLAWQLDPVIKIIAEPQPDHRILVTIKQCLDAHQ